MQSNLFHLVLLFYVTMCGFAHIINELNISPCKKKTEDAKSIKLNQTLKTITLENLSRGKSDHDQIFHL